MKLAVRLALLHWLWSRACAVDPCWDHSSLNRNPVTNKGGVDGAAVLTGDLYQLADYDYCVYARQETYCLSTVRMFPINTTSPLSAHLQEHARWWTHFPRDSLRWAVCVPQECRDVAELRRSLEAVLVPAGQELGVDVVVSLRPSDCSTARDQPPTPATGDYILRRFLLLIVCLLLVGTLYDILQSPISTETKKSESKDKKVRDERRADVPCNSVLKCFSVSANIARLHSPCKVESLRAIQGIRFLTMFGIITGHCFFFNLQGAVTNVTFVDQRYQEWLSMLFINGHMIVSAFFVVSGFLRAYHFLGHMVQAGRISAGAVLSSLFLRYLRLTPPLAVVITVTAIWLPGLGTGPLWREGVGRIASECRDTWWTNLLYVNNYVRSDRLCLAHTWFLAVDCQLFVVSLVLLVLVWLWPRGTSPLLAASLGACVLTSFLQTYTYQLRASLLTTPTVVRNLMADDTFLHSYITMQSNAVPYFVGLAFGVAYHKLDNGKINKLWIVKWWTLLVPLLFAPVLSGYFLYQPDYEYNRLLESIYAAIYRIPFAYAVGSAIMLFGLGYGWIVNDILSCKLCIVLGRLTYSAYLVHFVWQAVEFSSRKQPLHISAFELTRASFLDLMFSYIWGFLLCISIEMPTTALITYFVQRKSADAKKKQTGKQLQKK